MAQTAYRYPAYLMNQTSDSKALVLFGAPATEIEKWVGVPQRGRLGDGETVGFQREASKPRLRELAEFFHEVNNVVQNPLLCALQEEASVRFTPMSNDSCFGEIEIETGSLHEFNLLELIDRLIDKLETRVPPLKDHPIDTARLEKAIRAASEIHTFTDPSDDSSAGDDNDGSSSSELDEPQNEASEDPTAVLLLEETQLVDFYQELRIRRNILARLNPTEIPESLLGFSKDAMLSYLEPVVLVDGQHRLGGAVKAAHDAANSPEGRAAVREMIEMGTEPDDAVVAITSKYSRKLPVSLLMDPSPSEHVFQFVVVNQKATPIGKALLGTIVSTSLSRDELEPVAQRLRNSGIRLEDSQAIAYLTRAEESPFHNLVQTGVSDSAGLLQWNVLKGLTTIFRELKGGTLFHQKNDYAARWRRRMLPNSKYIPDYIEEGKELEYWSTTDGPWREVFIRFFTLVRDEFGSNDPGTPNYWGNTAGNLFNRVSLTILAADFFQFLDDKDRTLNTAADVNSAFESWLEGVDRQYFARPWKMDGLKKDQKAVRIKWAQTWFEYRKDPERLPRVENYHP
ncbi:hypothetical protein [Rhodococcus ruber]|uniref:hypothetical protein n=1 Tax=Rhodococcus ruber TaxID=1830 RepID=UPI0007CD899B|nr:hypothetical protein [Rhodococcus ruber]